MKLLILLAIMLPSIGLYAQPKAAPQALKAFMQSPMNIEYTKRGGASYIPTSTDNELFTNLSYDYPDFADASLMDDKGNSYGSPARYNRVTKKIEILYAGKISAVKESELPNVSIGRHQYRAIVVLTKAGQEAIYVEIQAQTPDGGRAAGKIFQVYQASNVSQDRGIITPGGGEKFKIDSSSYLLGFRPLPFEVPKRAKSLVSDLSVCEREALEASGKYRNNTDEFMQEFIKRAAACE